MSWPQATTTTRTVQTETGPTSIDVPRGVSVHQMGTGDAYAFRCAQMVRKLAIGAQFDPYVVNWARSIVSRAPEREYDGYCREIRAFLSRYCLFVRDVRDADNIDSPAEQLCRIEEAGQTAGDCDDIAALGAGLALCVSCNVRLVLIGFHTDDAPFEHIYAQCQGETGGRWWDLDVTKPQGMTPPVSRFHVIEV